MTKPALKILLVDDERLARKYLRGILATMEGVIVVGEASSVQEADAAVRREKPDLILLDVQMPPESGFDLLPRLDPAPAIIFVTAHDTFAVKAFETSAVDYMLKPVSPERLSRAIHRARYGRSFPVEPSEKPLQQLTRQDSLVLRDSHRIRRARIDEITVIEAEGAYTKVHFAEGHPMMVLRGITEWNQLLPIPPFARLDRSVLLNLTQVRSMEVRSRDESKVTVGDAGFVLLLGRVGTKRLRELL